MAAKNKTSNPRTTSSGQARKRESDARDLYERGREDDNMARRWMSGDRFDERDRYYGQRNEFEDRGPFDNRRDYDQRFDEDPRRGGYHAGGVEGNRNPARGESYYGYGRYERNPNWRYGDGRYDDDDRFYNDRGYSRDMYARNDRSSHRDHNPRYDERGYGGGGYPHDERSNYDQRYNRDDYDNMYNDRNRYQNDNRRYEDRDRRNDQREGRQRVVGRGMYGNHPSGRYSGYGDDSMHGNMGGGSWQGNNEYQVGGGTGYQPSDAGTYGAYSGDQQRWDDEQEEKTGKSTRRTNTAKSGSKENKTVTGKRNKTSNR